MKFNLAFRIKNFSTIATIVMRFISIWLDGKNENSKNASGFFMPHVIEVASEVDINMFSSILLWHKFDEPMFLTAKFERTVFITLFPKRRGPFLGLSLDIVTKKLSLTNLVQCLCI